MAELTKFFASNSLYEAWKDNKEVPSNVIAVVLDETGEEIQKVALGNGLRGGFEACTAGAQTAVVGFEHIEHFVDVELSLCVAPWRDGKEQPHEN